MVRLHGRVLSTSSCTTTRDKGSHGLGSSRKHQCVRLERQLVCAPDKFRPSEKAPEIGLFVFQAGAGKWAWLVFD
jgi:hypothetical protein